MYASTLEKMVKEFWQNTFVPCMYKFESTQAIYVRLCAEDAEPAIPNADTNQITPGYMIQSMEIAMIGKLMDQKTFIDCNRLAHQPRTDVKHATCRPIIRHF